MADPQRPITVNVQQNVGGGQRRHGLLWWLFIGWWAWAVGYGWLWGRRGRGGGNNTIRG